MFLFFALIASSPGLTVLLFEGWETFAFMKCLIAFLFKTIYPYLSILNKTSKQYIRFDQQVSENFKIVIITIIIISYISINTIMNGSWTLCVHMCTASSLFTSQTRVLHLLQPMNLLPHIIFTQNLLFRLEFTLGVVQSTGLGKFIMTRFHH